MKHGKRILALTVILMLLLQCSTLALTPAASTPTGGTTVVSNASFMQHAVANTSTGITVTKATGEIGYFADYLSVDVVSTTGGASRALNYKDTAGDYGLSGNVASGDVMLARMVVRAANEDGSNSSLYLALYSAATETDRLTTSSVSVTSAWTEVYVPVTAKDAVNIINVRVGSKVQKLDLAVFELINYKNTKTIDQLPSGATVITSLAPAGGSTVISPTEFYNNAKGNGDGIAVSKKTGNGKYTQYLSADVVSTTGKAAGRAYNYYDTDGDLSLSGNVKSGDVVLARIVVRGQAADGGDAKFHLALYNGDTDSADRLTTSAVTVGMDWTEVYIPMVATDAANRLNVRVGYQLQTVDIAEFELINYTNQTTTDKLPSTKYVLEKASSLQGEETKVDFFAEISGEEKDSGLVDHPKAKTFTSLEVAFDDTADIATGDVLVFSLVVRAARSTKLTVTIDKKSDVSMTYHVPVQWTQIRIPVVGTGLSKLTLSAEAEIEIAGAAYTDHNAADVFELGQTTGMFMLDDFSYYALKEQGAGAGDTIDLVKNGNYVYSIGDGKLTVTNVAAAPVITDTIEGLGANIRQIALTEDKEHVMITSRENGAYIVNVKDPYNIYVRTTYHSIEMATGISITGDFAYVCNRQYGVEIVDISDLDHPVQVSIVRAGEVQSCKAVDGVLYCGVWGTRSVEMYDISDPNHPSYLGSAALNGKGDGMAVYQKDGKTYLYAATGQHSGSVSNSDPLTVLDYGQGNGLDIFDVTDPQNPVHLSTSKIDGRYYYTTYDYWETEIAEGEDGHLYAYLVNTFNGVYVYNVDDPTAPRRVAHIDVPIATTSDNYVYYTSSSRTLVFPYDQKEAGRSPIGACVVEDGKMYLAGVLTDLHIFEENTFLYQQAETAVAFDSAPVDNSYYDFDGSALQGYELLDTAGQINAVESYGERYFLAAGSEGIIEIDGDMNRLSTTATDGLCFDVAIYGDTLYAAEGDNGVSAYRIGSKGLSRLWTYTSDYGTVRTITLSPKGRFVAFQAGARYAEIISTETQKRVVYYRSGSQMYYRNVSPLIGGRYVFIWGFSSGGGNWYDFGTEDNYDAPVLVRNIASHRLAMRGNMADYNGKVLSALSSGYIMYDPADTDVDLDTLKTYKDSNGTDFCGFMATSGDLMVVTDRMYGHIYLVDITDITAPKVMKSIDVAGNPDQALISGGSIWIPAGYQGLMRFDLSYWQEATGHSWNAGEQTKPATCTTLGEITFSCSDCSATRIEKTACSAHTWNTEYTVDTAATCGKAGSKSIYCADCSAIKVGSAVEIPATGRHTAGALITDTAATCGADGVGHKECTGCHQTLERNITIPATGEHKYGEYIYNNDATYESDGTKSRTCSVCGNKETVTAEGTKLTKPPVITNPFVDVKEGKFYYDAVLWAASENITSGTTATTFSPDNACTRGQIVTFLWRAAGSPKASTSQTPFTDIKKGSFYYDAVLWAVENGITTGTSATTFSPNSTCTRGQIVTFLWRFWGEKEAAVANPFTDTASGAYYTKAMLWAVESGITTGTSATTFSPNNACTRGQCVTFLYRSFGN